ncbi:MAG TPA: exo-alpha-sialidase [Candidatus Fraserbacteria bacterium]|nr:exo-alpha-sialidase [Candidatus Fraserbacteria bacterium]
MRRSIIWLRLVLLTLSGLGLAVLTLYGSSSLLIGPNVKVIRDNNNRPCLNGIGPRPNFDCDNLPQNEPSIAVDPSNPNILAAGANDYRLELLKQFSYFPIWMGYYRSTDDGRSWSNSFIPGYPGDISPAGRASPLHDTLGMSDPVLAFDRRGTLFYAGLALFDLDNDQNGLVVARYTDHGATYAGATLVVRQPAGLFTDKPCMAIDNSGGLNDGNIYLGWTRGSDVVSFSRSADHGRSFSSPQVINTPRTGPRRFPAIAFSCTIALGPSGQVFLFWRAFNLCHFNPKSSTCQAPSLDQPESINMAVSHDAGRSFGPVSTVEQIHPFDQLVSTLAFRHWTFPSAASDGRNVYLAWEDWLPGRGSRVLISCSANGGQDWQSPIVVSPWPTGHQLMPTLAVSDGLIKVAWYDSRNDPGFSPSSPVINRLDVYYAQAPVGCPVHFPASAWRVTQQTFRPDLRIFPVSTRFPASRHPFIGDYIGIASAGAETHVIWTDNRDVVTSKPCSSPDQGCFNQNIYTATIRSR